MSEDDDNFKSRTPKVSKNRKMHFDNKNRILSSRAGNSASKHKPKFLLKSILETSNDEPFSTQIDDTIHNSNVLTEPNLTYSIFSTATTNTEPNVRKEEKPVDDNKDLKETNIIVDKKDSSNNEKILVENNNDVQNKEKTNEEIKPSQKEVKEQPIKEIKPSKDKEENNIENSENKDCSNNLMKEFKLMKKKKIIALCISLGMIASVTACGNQENPVATSEKAPTAI